VIGAPAVRDLQSSRKALLFTRSTRLSLAAGRLRALLGSGRTMKTSRSCAVPGADLFKKEKLIIRLSRIVSSLFLPSIELNSVRMFAGRPTMLRSTTRFGTSIRDSTEETAAETDVLILSASIS